VQIPNLRVRANQYLGRLVERRLFGVNQDEAEIPGAERAWLGFYAVASFLYRTFVMCAIALFIASQYLLVGVILALWAAVTAVLLPLGKGIGYLLMHPRLRRRRPRARGHRAFASSPLWSVFVLPLPRGHAPKGRGGAAEESHLRAGTGASCARSRSSPARRARRTQLGSPRIRCLALRGRVLDAEVRLLEARATALRMENRVRWAMTLDELEAARRQLEEVRTRLAELTIVSPVAGTFVLVHAAADLPDRFLRRGEQVGYVLPSKVATARVLVSQDDVDLVRTRTLRVEAKVAGRLYDTYEARLAREVPAASNRVSNLALSSAGGGAAALDPRQSKEPRRSMPGSPSSSSCADPALALGEHCALSTAASRSRDASTAACGSSSCGSSRCDHHGFRRARLPRARRRSRRQVRAPAHRAALPRGARRVRHAAPGADRRRRGGARGFTAFRPGAACPGRGAAAPAAPQGIR
jgi:putative peptide zinc metalloprotease protein